MGQVFFGFFFFFLFFFFPLCLVRKAVGCGLHVLYITDIGMLGFPTRIRVKLSFLTIWLDKGRRYKRRVGIVLRPARRPSQFSKGQSRGGKTACRGFSVT